MVYLLSQIKLKEEEWMVKQKLLHIIYKQINKHKTDITELTKQHIAHINDKKRLKSN